MAAQEARQSSRPRSLWQQWTRARWSGSAALLVVLLATLLPGTDFLERLELRTQDARFRWRGPRHTTAPIVLAVLDNDTVQTWDQDRMMALWGTHYADLIRQARHYGAAWIGFDIIPAVRSDETFQLLVTHALEQARQGKPLTDEEVQALASPDLNPDAQFQEAVRQQNGHVVLADQGALTPELKDLMPEAYIGIVNRPSSRVTTCSGRECYSCVEIGEWSPASRR